MVHRTFVINKKPYFSAFLLQPSRIFFFLNDKEKRQYGGKTISAYSAYAAPWLFLKEPGFPTHHSLPWWFREMRLDGSWKPGSTRSRRPWAEVWSTLSWEQKNRKSYQKQACCTPCKLHCTEPNHQYKKVPCHTSEKRRWYWRRGGRGNYSGTLDHHINTGGINPESITMLLAHLYISSAFQTGKQWCKCTS